MKSRHGKMAVETRFLESIEKEKQEILKSRNQTKPHYKIARESMPEEMPIQLRAWVEKLKRESWRVQDVEFDNGLEGFLFSGISKWNQLKAFEYYLEVNGLQTKGRWRLVFSKQTNRIQEESFESDLLTADLRLIQGLANVEGQIIVAFKKKQLQALNR